MPELEYILMKKTGQPYRLCRQLVLDSRQTLGIGKYDPWTEILHDAAMRLYVARHGHKSDADSTTVGSYSLDGSEEISHSHEQPGTDELIMPVAEEQEDKEIARAEMGSSGLKKHKGNAKYKRLIARLRRALVLRASLRAKSKNDGRPALH
jgi:hypothetical protein